MPLDSNPNPAKPLEKRFATTAEMQFINLTDKLIQENSDLIKANQELDNEAIIDPLTGLYNRRFLAQQLEIFSTDREINSVTVVMCDVDKFKEFNDTKGHPAGDGLLQFIAHKIIETVRAGDIPARYGGDEYIILLKNLCKPDEVEHFTARLHTALNSSDGSVTIGYSTVNRVGNDPIDMVKAIELADNNLYQKKNSVKFNI